MYLAKDFIEISEGLVFAVVESGMEEGGVLCFLRYRQKDSQWQKLGTDEANELLSHHYPEYLYFSPLKQAHCHAVPTHKIVKHHQPRERIQHILEQPTTDRVEQDVVMLCDLFKQHGLDLNELGVTGSILIGAQKQSSDIDLVFYSKQRFDQARKIIEILIQQGECATLDNVHWEESFDRRSCELNYEEYVWHEQRKLNKVMINHRKVDLSFVSDISNDEQPIQYKKLEFVTLTVQVIDDALAFNYPAEFTIRHPHIDCIVSYTATYTGQAKTGEWVEVAGMVEEGDDGRKRIVVGSSREAKGEYIKVIRDAGLTKLPHYSAIIFDMDGLVLDTESTYCRAWQQAALAMDMSLSNEFCLSLSGLHFKDMEQKLVDHCGSTFDTERFFTLSGKCWRESVNQHGIAEKKGFSNLLNKLKTKGIPFCLATNSARVNALECLELAGLKGIFPLIITRDEVAEGKPAPDIFLTAADKLNQPINQCLVLEDSETGIQAAVAASAPCVFIPSTLPVKRVTANLADCFLMDLDELAQII